jgi:regulation of enolase protein 1 (concanavalin A-like superfamily)
MTATPCLTARGAAAILLLTAALTPRVAASADTPAATDRAMAEPVRLATLPQPGTWLNAPQAFERLSDDAIQITAGTGTDLYADNAAAAVTATAPMLLFPVEGDFVLTARLSSGLDTEYDGAFLVLYENPRHWAKLLLEKSHYGPYSACSAVTDTYSDDTVNHEVGEKFVWFRVARQGQSAVFYSSLDGELWRYQRYFRFAGAGALKVGFGAQAPVGPQSTAAFSEIRFISKAPADFWTGK